MRLGQCLPSSPTLPHETLVQMQALQLTKTRAKYAPFLATLQLSPTSAFRGTARQFLVLVGPSMVRDLPHPYLLQPFESALRRRWVNRLHHQTVRALQDGRANDPSQHHGQSGPEHAGAKHPADQFLPTAFQTDQQHPDASEA